MEGYSDGGRFPAKPHRAGHRGGLGHGAGPRRTAGRARRSRHRAGYRARTDGSGCRGDPRRRRFGRAAARRCCGYPRHAGGGRTDRRGTWRGRYPGQQCRYLRPSASVRADRGGRLRRDAGRPCQIGLLSQPGGRPRDEGPALGTDHQRVVDVRHDRQPERAALYGRQGRAAGADQGAGARARPVEHHRQCPGAGPGPHRDDPPEPRRRRGIRPPRCNAADAAARRAARSRLCGRLPGFPIRPP